MTAGGLLEVQAASWPRYAAKLLSGRPQAGRVLAAFHRTAYVDFGNGELVCLGVPTVGNGPFTVLIRWPPLPMSDWLRPGAHCVAGGGHLTAGPLTVHLTGATCWEATWLAGAGSPGARTNVAQRLDRLWELFRDQGRCDSPGWMALFGSAMETGGAYPIQVARQARRGLDGMRRGITSACCLALAEAAAGLVGLGPGLTPTGDDMIAGCMVGTQLAAVAVGESATFWHELWGSVIEGVEQYTTPVAAAFLRHAARGVVAESIERLLKSVLGQGDLESALDVVLRLGATSGNDFLAGFLVGASAGRKETENGSSACGHAQHLL